MPIASFRDPSGFVLAKEQRVFRVVRREAADAYLQFLGSGAGRELLQRGDLIASRSPCAGMQQSVLSEVSDRIASWETPAAVLEHDFVWFPSFAYEWPSAMLREAGRVTLAIASDLLADGYGLKDATPFNILFRGPTPVLVDAMSIERRNPQDPLWRPLAQFLQTFLYPLVLERATGALSSETLLGRREGLDASDLYRRLGWAQRLSNLRWVSIPHWLSGREVAPADYSKRPSSDPEAARAMLASTFRSLRGALDATEARASRETAWNQYSVHCHYDQASRDRKHAFVREALAALASPGRVLDLGANDGEYSLEAARAGHETVSCDLDAACMNALWHQARQQSLPVLPLVVNLSNPTPACGWGNQEHPSFLRRAQQAQFDCVLMLALLHHLTVTERAPLSLIVDLAASLTARSAVIEWIGPQDPFYRRLVRGRDELYANDTRENFEAACAARFDIVRKAPLIEGRRWIYLLERRRGS